MKGNKTIAIMVALCMLLSVFSACTGQPQTPSDSSAAPTADEKPYKGTTIHVLLNTHDYYDLADPLIKDFEAETGITVVMEHLERVSLATKQEMELGTGTGAYDIMLIDASKVTRYEHAGWVEPLDGLIASSDPNITKPDFDYDDYFPAYADIFKTNDKILGLPCIGEATMLFYRKDLFEQAGIKEAPETWDEVEQAAIKLKQLGVDGLGLRARAGEGLNVYIWPSLLYAYGGRYVDDNGYPVLNSPEAVKATQKFADLVNKYGPVGAGDMTHADHVPAFQQGTLGMFYDASVFNANFSDPEKSKVVDTWMAAPAPVGADGKGASAVASHGLMIAKNSKHKEAAWQFMQWYTGTELQKKVALDSKKFGAIVHKSVMEAPEYQSIYGQHNWAGALKKSLQYMRPDYRMVDNPDWPWIGDRIGKAIQDTIVGNGTAQQNMETLNNDLTEFMKEKEYIK